MGCVSVITHASAPLEHLARGECSGGSGEWTAEHDEVLSGHSPLQWACASETMGGGRSCARQL